MTTATLSEGRHEAADQGERRHQAALYSVPTAAEILNIPIRTLRDWIQAGKVRTLDPIPPQRGRQIPAEELDRLQQAAAAEGGTGRQVEAADQGNGRHPAAPEGERRQGEAGESATHPLHLEPPELQALRAQLAAVEHERDTLADHSDFLKQQLQAREDARREELERRDQAEAELRRLLLVAQQSLAAMIERPMLSAADIQPETPKRARWWFFGRRSV